MCSNTAAPAFSRVSFFVPEEGIRRDESPSATSRAAEKNYPLICVFVFSLFLFSCSCLLWLVFVRANEEKKNKM